MFVHVIWSALLYMLLTIARAPEVWGIGSKKLWNDIEPRVSANLANQFEWPILFYVVCLLQLSIVYPVGVSQIWLAWLFILGRILHSLIQILTTNIRLRGLVFTVNFLAVLAMWFLLFLH